MKTHNPAPIVWSDTPVSRSGVMALHAKPTAHCFAWEALRSPANVPGQTAKTKAAINNDNPVASSEMMDGRDDMIAGQL